MVSGSGGSSDGRAGGSAEQVAEALDQEEARQLSLFRAEVRRTSWLSGSVSAALPDLSGLWHAEWSRASRRRSKRAQASDDSAAGGSVAGRLLLVNVVGRGETWSALALGDDAAGELCWQADSTARAMTSFGLPGYGALLRSSPAQFARCVMVISREVLYFYVETRCELRCWRTGHRDGDGATRATRANRAARADEVQPVPSVGGGGGGGGGGGSGGGGSGGGGSGGGGGGGGGGRKRQRSAVSEAEAHTRAAAAVDRWAAGRAGLPALLVALSEFRGVFGPEARQKLLQAAPAAEGATGPAAARQVTRAYHAACLQLHPDRHATSPPEMRALAEELFKVLSAAFVDFRALPGSPGLSC